MVMGLGKPAKRPGFAKLVWPPDEVRNLGIFCMGYKGSGKSRFIGREVARQDLWRGIPQVVIDPVGGTIDNLLDCILRASPEERKIVLSRLRYFDCSGQGGRVCPLPLYYRLGNESWEDVANRYIDAILTLDPDLASASIQGANAIKRVGMPVGMVLAAAGLQITEAKLLLDQPKAFKPLLTRLRAETDDWGLRDACNFFLSEYMGWDPSKRMQEAGSFRGKFYALTQSNPTIAIFGANRPGIDFNQMIEQGQTILLDFSRDQQNPALLKFKMLWWFYYFLNFIKYRGAGLSNKPIGLVVDEISLLASQSEVWEAEINSLYNIWARQGMVWPTMATQELFQLLRHSDWMFKSLMGSGTILCGRSSDLEGSLKLAEELVGSDRSYVKRYEPIYGADGSIIAERRVDLSHQEKILLDAYYLFKNQPKLHFLVKQIGDERLHSLSLEAELDPGIYPDDNQVTEFQDLLNQKCGVPIDTILTEIEDRQARLEMAVPQASKQDKKKPSRKLPGKELEPRDTLAGNGQSNEQSGDLPPETDGNGEDSFDELFN